MNMEDLVVYVVRSSTGKFFRAKGYAGYAGYGSTWVDDINSAKIYGKIGPARSRVTWFTNNYPNYPIPDLIKLTVSNIEVIDESARVNKAIADKQKREALREERDAKEQISIAERELQKAKLKLDRLKKGE